MRGVPHVEAWFTDKCSRDNSFLISVAKLGLLLNGWAVPCIHGVALFCMGCSHLWWTWLTLFCALRVHRAVDFFQCLPLAFAFYLLCMLHTWNLFRCSSVLPWLTSFAWTTISCSRIELYCSRASRCLWSLDFLQSSTPW